MRRGLLVVGLAAGCIYPIVERDLTVIVVETDRPAPDESAQLQLGVGLRLDLGVLLMTRRDHGIEDRRGPMLEVVPSVPGVIETFQQVGGLTFGLTEDVIEHGGAYGVPGTLLRVTLTAPGQVSLELVPVEDRESAQVVKVQGHTVDRVTFRVGGAAEVASGATVPAFTGSTVDVVPTYWSGALPVLGLAPLQLSAPAGTTLVDERRVQLGPAPHDAVLGTPVGGGLVTVRAVGAEDIADIALTVNSLPVTGVIPLSVGARLTLSARPLDGMGDWIVGLPPEIDLAVAGDAARIEDQRRDSAQLVGVTPGDTVVTLTWGSAVVVVTIRVGA